MSVDRDALFFNDMVAISERVYMDHNSSWDSNYAPLNQGTL